MKKEINVQIGLRIRKLREERNMSREQLAELLDLSPVFLAYVEYGQKGVSLTTLQNICQTLQVSADYLLLGREPGGLGKTEAQILVENLDPRYQALTAEFLRALIKTFAQVNKANETGGKAEVPSGRDEEEAPAPRL